MRKFPKPRTTLRNYLRVQERADREIYFLLRRTAGSIDETIQAIVGTGIGSAVRADQMEMVRRVAEEQMALMMREAGFTIEASKHEAAAAAVNSSLAYDKVLADAANIPADVFEMYRRSALETARFGLEAARERLLGASYIPLSEQVYRTTALASGTIDRLIDTSLAKGLNARELASAVRGHIRPDVPGGVSHAAIRLARTEINNAFHATQIQKARTSPWVLGVEWNLSGSHYDTGCVCPTFASDKHTDDLPAGVFPKNEVPRKPHPNCLCYTTSYIPDPDEMIDIVAREMREFMA